MRLGRVLVAMLALWPLGMGEPRAADSELCARAIERSEAAGALPAGLLTAVAASESGRYDRSRRGVAPWPWTVNNAGDGRYFPSKAEAIAHVERLKAAGERNIDVGCMQINLMHHPDAFSSLDDAFEPTRNVAYGARFPRRAASRRPAPGSARSSATTRPTRTAAAPIARRSISAGRKRAPATAPGAGEAVTPPVLMASVAPERRYGAPAGERRKLKPLSGRGFVSLGTGAKRVAILRPSADRQLKPIVRPPRRSSIGLVRLTSQRRAVLAMAP